MTDDPITMPRRGRGRPPAAAEERYQAELGEFCRRIRQIRSILDFTPSARGWCYLLEEHGLQKGEFETAGDLISSCRKSGLLPLDIVSEDSARQADGLEDVAYGLLGHEGELAQAIVREVSERHRSYVPFSFWEGQPHYVEMLVEKIDLRELFAPVCRRYRVPITNAKGWSDIWSRARIMQRFANWERKGCRPVLLYCGDHDPAGLAISGSLRSNFEDLAAAVGWSPTNLVITRFGLNADFVDAQGLSWINNLETSGGTFPLDHPRHPDHRKPYVQSYLARFGARKCEANALVVRPEAGRDLCRQAILRYVDEDAPADYQQRLAGPREDLRQAIIAEMGDHR